MSPSPSLSLSPSRPSIQDYLKWVLDDSRKKLSGYPAEAETLDELSSAEEPWYLRAPCDGEKKEDNYRNEALSWESGEGIPGNGSNDLGIGVSIPDLETNPFSQDIQDHSTLKGNVCSAGSKQVVSTKHPQGLVG